MRSQNRLVLLSFSLAILVGQLGLIPSAVAIPNPIDNGGGRRDRRTASLPAPPSTPPPAGERTPGGGLGEDPVCPATPYELTAITPDTVYGKTLSERPTLWFYMPYTSADVEQGEFTILTADDTERVYRATFTLPDQPGLVSVTLPEAAMINLEEGQRYHWYLKVFCASDATVKTNININGWIDRLATTPERQQQVTESSPEIWYDTVHRLAKYLQTTPCETMGQLWNELLDSVELEQFIEAPILGPLVLTEN